MSVVGETLGMLLGLHLGQVLSAHPQGLFLELCAPLSGALAEAGYAGATGRPRGGEARLRFPGSDDPLARRPAGRVLLVCLLWR